MLPWHYNARYNAGIVTEHATQDDEEREDDGEAAAFYRQLRLSRPLAGGLLFPLAQLLGADFSWVDEDGKGGDAMAEQTVSDLAQAAIADIFERLEQLGTITRNKCRAKYGDLAPPVSRKQVAHALDYAESLIEYGRAQLGYLPHGGAYSLNERVIVKCDGADDALGIYMGLTNAGKLRVRIPPADGVGSTVDVEADEEDVRRVST